MPTIHKLYDNSLYRNLTEERKMADIFVEKLIYYIPKEVKGDIYVLPSMRCPNGDKKDLDLVVWFDFESYYLTDVISGHFSIDKGERKVEAFKTKKNIFFNNALCVFELKRHNRADVIKLNEQSLEVYYSANKTWKSATEQSDGQKYSLINFFKERLNIVQTPFVNNFIWMYETGEWQPAGHSNLENIIWGRFDYKFFINSILNSNPPNKQSNGVFSYSSTNHTDVKQKVTTYFEDLKKNKSTGLGILTRRKIQQILENQINIEGEKYTLSIGTKLIAIKGDPGTGKTLHLVKIAHHLSQTKDAKCLILTYNKALERDINRLCFHIGAADQQNVKTKTFHSFILSILIENGLIAESTNYEPDNLPNYLNQLIELLVGENNPKYELKIAYDFVLIDEAQDWNELQKKFIFSIFGFQNTILSYGKHQEVEGAPLDWGTGLNASEKETINLRISHRNKVNLVDFYNDFSKETIRPWNLKSNTQLVGGKLVIATKGIMPDLLIDLNKELHNNLNAPYDLMVLAPGDNDLNMMETNLSKLGYKCYNGGSSDRKKEFPTDEFRLLNYRSCRGLEAWTLICYNIDVYLAQMAEFYKHPANASYTCEEGIETERNNWLFMIFTRAIDTIVLSFDNNESAFAKSIINLAQDKFEGIIEWR